MLATSSGQGSVLRLVGGAVILGAFASLFACGETPVLGGARLFDGVPNPAVASTYGQVWTPGGAHLHDGLDLLAPETTTVLALEDGVARILPHGTFGNAGAIVVDAAARPGEAWLYEHVTPNAAVKAGGHELKTGDPIGTVAPALDGGYPHVHLERVSTLGAECQGNEDPCPALCDPLADPSVRAMIADSEPPLILPLRSNDLSLVDPGEWVVLHDEFDNEISPEDALGKPVDVICRAADRSRADGMEVAPYSLALFIDGPGDEDVEFDGLCFDGPLFEKCFSFDIADVVYCLRRPDCHSDFTQRELYFVPTSQLIEDGGRLAARNEPWVPTVPGPYDLTFVVRDHSGNESQKSITLVIGS